MRTVFGIIGGDKRQLYLARALENDGYEVYICGFELSSDTKDLVEDNIKGVLRKCDYIILPLPCTRDGKTIFAPYSSEEIVVDQNFIAMLENKTVFGGFINKLSLRDNDWSRVNIGDYYLREELAISNAVPTAEGAICLGIKEHMGILNGSHCLVTGYGRIGKILTKDLIGLGAKVDVAARKNKDFAMIKAMGATALKYSDIRKEYDIIFNTVPEIVIDKVILSKQSPETVIIELASSPGGVDKKSADENQIKVVEAQSLPGKFAPKATGEFIKQTIYNMMEE